MMLWHRLTAGEEGEDEKGGDARASKRGWYGSISVTIITGGKPT